MWFPLERARAWEEGEWEAAQLAQDKEMEEGAAMIMIGS
jgi:hypothetical protein